jgi:hypothetical protein
LALLVPRPGVEPGLQSPTQQDKYQQREPNKIGALHHLTHAAELAELGVFAAEFGTNQTQILGKFSPPIVRANCPKSGPSQREPMPFLASDLPISQLSQSAK